MFFKYFFFEAVGSKFYYPALQAILVNLTEGMGFANIFDNYVFVDIASLAKVSATLSKSFLSSSGSFIPLITK